MTNLLLMPPMPTPEEYGYHSLSGSDSIPLLKEYEHALKVWERVACIAAGMGGYLPTEKA